MLKTSCTLALRRLAALASLALVVACASTPEPEGPPRKETVLALTQNHELIRFNAGQPRRVLDRKPLVGLPAGDSLIGIDFRISRGVLYGLSRQGLLFTINPATGQLTRVGNKPLAVALEGDSFGLSSVQLFFAELYAHISETSWSS